MSVRQIKLKIQYSQNTVHTFRTARPVKAQFHYTILQALTILQTHYTFNYEHKHRQRTKSFDRPKNIPHTERRTSSVRRTRTTYILLSFSKSRSYQQNTFKCTLLTMKTQECMNIT